VRAGDATVLVDCGRGVVMRLAGAGLVPVGLTAVLLTHLHSDHISDLNDIITTHWVMAPEPTPLPVYGPPGTQAVIDALLAMLGPDQQYRLDHHADLTQPPRVEVTEVEPGDTFTLSGTVSEATVTVGATDHRPVAPTVGFRIDQGGESAVLAGDTVPCSSLDELCAGADLYVQTVIRADLVQLLPNARIQDILDYHSTVEQAAQTATRAGVRTLVLTHYVPPLVPGQEDDWRALAAAHFDGPVVLGDDLTRIAASG
jgi:ribonuclease Z